MALKWCIMPAKSSRSGTPSGRKRQMVTGESLSVATIPPQGLAAAAAVEVPKVIMSKAQRRKLKKPPVVVTTEMKEKVREDKRELRKHLRMLKSNGARRKVAKLREKRSRETSLNEEAVNALDTDFRPMKKGRRME